MRSKINAGFMVKSLPVVMLTLSLLLGLASASEAASRPHDRNGVLEKGEVGFFHNSNQKGSFADYVASDPDYGRVRPFCDRFLSPGLGHGKCIRNDVASVWNRSSRPVTVYEYPNYRGRHQTITPGGKANLQWDIKNNNASHRVGGYVIPLPRPGTVTRAQVTSKAQEWVDAKVPYSMQRTRDGYRTDCSGFASRAYGLSRPGETTQTLNKHGRYIKNSQLKRGDLLLWKKDTGNRVGHVRIFDKWANEAKTKVWVYEQASGVGAVHRIVDWDTQYKPLRMNKIAD